MFSQDTENTLTLTYTAQVKTIRLIYIGIFELINVDAKDQDSAVVGSILSQLQRPLTLFVEEGVAWGPGSPRLPRKTAPGRPQAAIHPHVPVARCAPRNSKFGQALVIETTASSHLDQVRLHCL